MIDATEVLDPVSKAPDGSTAGERPRGEDRVVVRGKLRDGAGSCTFPNASIRRRYEERSTGAMLGHTDDNGCFEAILYKSDFERLRRTKVETRMDLVKQAYETYHQGLRSYVLEQQSKSKGQGWRRLPADPHEWDQAERRLASGYNDSPESIFAGYRVRVSDRSTACRNMRPLEYLEAIEEMPPPETPETRATVQAARALSAVSASDELADLRRQLAELKAMLADKPAKKQPPQQ